MHFAYPARKTSQPHLFTSRSNNRPFAVLRKNGRLQSIGILAVGVIGFLWLIFHITAASSSSSGRSEGRRSRSSRNAPRAVVVTVFDEATSKSYQETIKDNRRDYASRHGYATFFTNTSAYPLDALTPRSWTVIPALRHAMTLYPDTPFLFYLSPTAVIMAPELSLDAHIMNPARLESIMLPDRPIVPPDSVIKTFSHVKGSNVDFVLTQDPKGLSQHSMVLRTGEWAKFFLDAWFDPLYRSYNFQKAERHALEHIAQWHGTILARLALVPQRTMNSYANEAGGSADAAYADGDFVANYPECAHRQVGGPQGDEEVPEAEKGTKKAARRKSRKLYANECEREMQPMLDRWREMVDRQGRRGR